MSRPFRLVLWVQAAALAAPFVYTSFTTASSILNRVPCGGEICINMWPAFWLLTLIIFFAPFIVVVDCARKGRALLNNDRIWLIGADVYVVAITGSLVAFWWPVTMVDVLAVIVVLPTLATAFLAVVNRRQKPADIHIA